MAEDRRRANVQFVATDPDRLKRYKESLEGAPPGRGTDTAFSLLNFCETLMGEKAALAAILKSAEEENAKMKKIDGLRAAASATEDEMAVIRFFIRRVTNTGESLSALAKLKADLQESLDLWNLEEEITKSDKGADDFVDAVSINPESDLTDERSLGQVHDLAQAQAAHRKTLEDILYTAKHVHASQAVLLASHRLEELFGQTVASDDGSQEKGG